jgi:hypothetical protein
VFHTILTEFGGYALIGSIPAIGSAAIVGVIFLLSRSERKSLAAERNRLRGICVNCGYDMRASAHYCPECGTLR